MRVAVLGGGAFGVVTAAHLAATGERVTLIERLPRLLMGASANANRLHQGFHYPRDEETARQCARGFARFRDEFSLAMLPGVRNAYFIARHGSLTSPADFLAFCERLELPFRVVDPSLHEPQVTGVSLGIQTDELVYDRHLLRHLLLERLNRSGAEVRVDAAVVGIRRAEGAGFDITTEDGQAVHYEAVVNCSYGSLNRLTQHLGHAVAERQYEYAAAAVISLDWPRSVSLTVLDGPFVSLLPLDGDGRYLLYHVEHSVVARQDTELLDPRWLDPAHSPFAAIDRQRWFEGLLTSCQEFFPSLRGARLEAFLEGPRVVLSHADSTDARPSRVRCVEPGYFEVFSGKIDHCLWVAEEVAEALGCPSAGASALHQPLA